MSLRYSFAAVLQLLRAQKGLIQNDIGCVVSQPHISKLEQAKSQVSLDTAYQLASSMKIEPAALFALVNASHLRCTAREVLRAALADLEDMGLADAALPIAPRQPLPPGVLKARKKWIAVQKLKSSGLSQAQAAKELDMAESTLRRLWHREL